MMKLWEATVQDIDSIVEMIKAMLQDMVSCGGHALNEESRIELQLRTHLAKGFERTERIVLLAALEGVEKKPVGMIEASITSLHEVFQPKRVLHIHSIYVERNCRRKGIGRSLLEAVWEWGEAKGCVEAELNVLLRNPARRLYEDLGFRAFEVEMRRDLAGI
jgi:GNAT superfamily N-acetyltransferase